MAAVGFEDSIYSGPIAIYLAVSNHRYSLILKWNEVLAFRFEYNTNLQLKKKLIQ
jgi:hypothetical protein